MTTLLQTKPKYCPGAIATEQGWISPSTKELLVSIKHLKTRLLQESEREEQMNLNFEPIIETPAPIEAVKEQKVKKLKKSQQIIAEVVEYGIEPEQEVIGE